MEKTEPPRIYTRTGDTGETALFDGSRVSKADPRVDAYGDVDECASWLGLVRARLQTPREAEIDARDLTDIIERLQRDLFALGSLLADPRHRIAARVEKAFLSDGSVERLEGWIDTLDRELPPLRHFILAGGSEPGAMLHLARSVCRRAERRMVGLGGDAIDPLAVRYVNRLSDLLFVMARVVNARTGMPEREW